MPRTGKARRHAVLAVTAAGALIAVLAFAAAAQTAGEPPAGALGAAAPSPPGPAAGPGVFYMSPFWLGLVAVIAALWLYATSWVAQDAKGAGLDFEKYTALMAAAGLVGLFFTFLVHAALALVTGALVVATFSVYIAVRNPVVPERFRYLGAYHRAELLNKMPLLNRLAIAQSSTTVISPARALTNAAGTSLDDIVVEQPGLAKAAEVLTNLVVRAGATRSRRVRFQPSGDQYVAQYWLDGVLYNLEAYEADLARQVLGCAAQFVGLSSGRGARQGPAELTTELPGTGPVKVQVTAGAVEGKPVLDFVLPDWTRELFRAGLDALGMHESIAKRLRAAMDQRRGAVIICGPAGSGKTSTLYAAAGALDVFTTNIVLIEQRPGPELEHMRRWLADDRHSFADVYQELMREGPDVLVLSTIQKPEHARSLLGFAAGGGLALGELKAPDSPEGLAALVKLTGDAELVGETVTCVLSQRLVRKLCTVCRQQVEPVPDLLQKLKIDPHEAGVWYRPVGCDACLNSGYHGRTAVFGMLILTDPVKEALASPDVSARSVRAAAGKAAFRTMQQDGIAKVTAGVTTLEELQRILSDRKTRS